MLDFLVSKKSIFSYQQIIFHIKNSYFWHQEIHFTDIEFIFISKYTPKILKTAPYETGIFWYQKSFSDIRKYNFWNQKFIMITQNHLDFFLS